MVHEDIYAQALKKAEEELEHLSTLRRDWLDRVQELDQRIQRIKQTIKALAALHHPRTPQSDSKGISDACKTVLKEGAGSAYTARSVRDELMARGWDLEKYKNPLAVIHTVLKRMAATQNSGVDRYERDDIVVYAFNPTMPEVEHPSVALHPVIFESTRSPASAAPTAKKLPRVMTNGEIPTVAIKRGLSYAIINLSDYNPDIHEPYEGPLQSPPVAED